MTLTSLLGSKKRFAGLISRWHMPLLCRKEQVEIKLQYIVTS